MLPKLIEAFRRQAAYRGLSRDLPVRGAARRIGGLAGSSPAALVATLAEDHPQRVFLVVTPTPVVAEAWLADLNELMGGLARLFPQREALGEEEPHLEIHGERVETIDAVLSGSTRAVVTTLRATMELTRMPSAIQRRRLEIRAGSSILWRDVVDRLEAMGYERTPSVVDVAQFAVRGGIIDVYGFGMAEPARLEWWGDELISVRTFDLDTQRSAHTIDAVTVLPMTAGSDEEEGPAADRLSILDLVPSDTLFVVDPAVDDADAGRMWEEATHHLDVARRRGEEVPGREVLYLDPKAWRHRWLEAPRLELGREPIDQTFRIAAPPPVERKMRRLARVVRAEPTLILCDNEGQLERLEEILSGDAGPERGLPTTVTLALGSLTGGFRLPELVVLTDHEVFQRQRRLRRARRYRQAIGDAVAAALTPGAYVVHLEHGIGIYEGIQTIAVSHGGAIEVAVLRYEGGDRLNVPLYRLDQIEPYRFAEGTEGPPPRLHRLGGKSWERQRAKTEAAINTMAAELLELYARRAVAEGFAFPADTRWQRELESSFLYEDTPDQRTATDETKRDMERPHPMDRLVVGDVGYGKTEVAVRAAFKAVEAGKQVAMLVPTTILAEQHGRTFSDRLADFPVRVEVLSRFRSAAEQRQVLEALRQGTVDIVIGTHRLLSSDVAFKSLGLLVVDEEHRFGVRHKERLKQLRLQVDVLTLTATPIPRTLHGALAGLRDLTMIQTPPRDRSPVLTFIEPWDDELIAEVLARELDRGGQVFFVHNRIETIEAIADRVRRLAPRAMVAVGHGKQRERDLDDVMRRFVAGEVDILVSTMIVESGLDVPNANTMIVHDAHQFGLAQLYQLRGRVGRGHRRAYCYLLVPDAVDPEAERRLKVLEHHTELGAGYWIALRDLELRGAGNLLGAQQSGHAHAVGFDLYLRWLDDAVRALRGEGGMAQRHPPDVTIDAPAHLPDDYIGDDHAKLDFYRRLARAQEAGEIARLREELRDRFGPIPHPAETLLLTGELRILGGEVGLQSILVRGDEARLKFRAEATPKLLRLTAAMEEVQFAAEVRNTVPLALKLRRLGGLDIGRGLARALAAATGTEA